MDITQLFAPSGDSDEPDGVEAAGRVTARAESLDDILDEIDAVLETNAEAFVQGFVQKGGQ